MLKRSLRIAASLIIPLAMLLGLCACSSGGKDSTPAAVKETLNPKDPAAYAKLLKDQKTPAKQVQKNAAPRSVITATRYVHDTGKSKVRQ